jgi:hypothetical protein
MGVLLLAFIPVAFYARNAIAQTLLRFGDSGSPSSRPTSIA